MHFMGFHVPFRPSDSCWSWFLITSSKCQPFGHKSSTSSSASRKVKPSLLIRQYIMKIALKKSLSLLISFFTNKFMKNETVPKKYMYVCVFIYMKKLPLRTIIRTCDQYIAMFIHCWVSNVKCWSQTCEDVSFVDYEVHNCHKLQ